jgi:Tol biopolymer transport system component/predicted Ser/Thr protein kinase
MDLTPEQFARLNERFDQAVTLPGPQRAALVEELRRNEGDGMADQLAALLKANDRATGTIGDPQVQLPQLAPLGAFREGEVILGRFRIVRVLGRGGMGEVWRARDLRLKRDVALKVLPVGLARDPDRIARFEREARAVAALNHPNICQIYDVGPDYLVMELVDGTPVAPPGDMRKLLDTAVQIADALAAAHETGIVHRDLKPDNILFTRDGKAKVLDFGIAKQIPAPGAGDATLAVAYTVPGTLLGTVAYMSPEQARGQELDARSDQFSFGLVLYELASGKRAFHGENSAEIMMAIMREQPEPLPATVPVPLRWAIERCLAKEPSERYDSTRDLYRELRQIRERLSEAWGAPPAAVAPKPLRARGTSVVLAALLALGIAAAAAFLPAPPVEPPSVTPIATEAEMQTMPAWSPKGDGIAYVASVGGVFQVFSRTLQSASPVQLTRHAQSCLGPQWSADGTRVYYEAGGAVPDYELWSVAVAGGEPEKLSDHVAGFAVSPIGNTVAVAQTDQRGHLSVAFSTPPGAPAQRYDKPPFDRGIAFINVPHMRFTNDATMLGLYLENQGFWQLPLNGGSVRHSSSSPSFIQGGFGWYRDNQTIVLSGLTTLHLITGESRQLGVVTGIANFPSLSPDGLTLAYELGEYDYDIVEFPLDGSSPSPLVATSRPELAPSWSPDGVHFLYVADRRGSSQEMWIRNRIDGTERLQPTPHASAYEAIFDCDFSPDGSRVAYRAEGDTSPPRIWISLLGAEAPVRMSPEDGAIQRGPSWSPDGNWIAFYSVHNGKPAIMKYRIGSNRPPELLVETSEPKPVRWSPRGDWIAYRDNKALRIVSPDGREKRALNSTVWETYGWSKDGQSLYGLQVNSKHHLVLGRIELADGKELQVSDLGPAPAAFDYGNYIGKFPIRGFSLHPDGKSFLTSVAKGRSQIVLMRGFDRSTRLFDWFRR